MLPSFLCAVKTTASNMSLMLKVYNSMPKKLQPATCQYLQATLKKQAHIKSLIISGTGNSETVSLIPKTGPS